MNTFIPPFYFNFNSLFTSAYNSGYSFLSFAIAMIFLNLSSEKQLLTNVLCLWFLSSSPIIFTAPLPTDAIILLTVLPMSFNTELLFSFNLHFPPLFNFLTLFLPSLYPRLIKFIHHLEFVLIYNFVFTQFSSSLLDRIQRHSSFIRCHISRSSSEISF